MELPDGGTDADEVIERLEAMGADDADWRGGRVFGLVYSATPGVEELGTEAHAMYAAENAVSPSLFPGLVRMENEVVAMTADLLGAPDAVGHVTSGGTESNLLAVKAARDLAREERGVRDPEIVAPETAHPSFAKAAHLFGMTLSTVPVRDDWRADPGAMADAITDETALVVGSAPSYPTGVVDPIEELGAVAADHGLPCHVDSCIGGFTLPFIAELGRDVPRFDLSVEGVTSISVDQHKYGYAHKGASTVLYADDDLRRRQYFVYDDWPGGVYSSPNITGSKTGGGVAAAWATMVHLGREGYRELVEAKLGAVDAIVEAVEATDGVRLLGDPESTLLAFAADGPVNVTRVYEGLTERGWTVALQQRPPNVHLTVTYRQVAVLDEFLADLDAAVEAARGDDREESAAVYGGGVDVAGSDDVEAAVRSSLSETYRP